MLSCCRNCIAARAAVDGAEHAARVLVTATVTATVPPTERRRPAWAGHTASSAGDVCELTSAIDAVVGISDGCGVVMWALGAVVGSVVGISDGCIVLRTLGMGVDTVVGISDGCIVVLALGMVVGSGTGMQ